MAINKERLYFDNASTSWPKPKSVIDTLSDFYKKPVGSYGRSMDERTLKYSCDIERLRDRIANIIGTSMPENIVFTKNATEASNIILNGIDFDGKNILISPLEHNAIMRPLYARVECSNSRITVMPSLEDGTIDTEKLQNLDLDSYHLAIINVEGNVNGVIQPIEEIVPILKRHKIEIMLDTAQYLDVTRKIMSDTMDIDYIVMTGHKKLMGPTGTGAMFIRNPDRVEPLFTGGNGFKSMRIDLLEDMPYRYEYGTMNMIGLLSLLSAVEATEDKTLGHSVWTGFIKELKSLDCKILCASDEKNQGSCISLLPTGKETSNVLSELYYHHGIICRDGIHCNPSAHSFLGTMPGGAIRISPNFFFHNERDINYLYDSIKNVLHK